MADGIFDTVPIVARWDEDLQRLDVLGRVAGPAGSASLQLGSLVVDVDVADAGDLVGLAVPLDDRRRPSPADRELLAALAGDRVTDVLAVASVGLSEPVRFPPSERASRVWGSYNRPIPEAGLIATAALAGQEIERPGRTATQLGVALLERAVAVVRLRWAGEGPRADASSGATLLLGAAPEPTVPIAGLDRLLQQVVALDLVDEVTARVLARLAGRLPGDRPATAAGGRRLSADRSEPLPMAMVPLAAARAAPAKVAAVVPLQPRLEVHPLALPGALAGGPSPGARWRHTGNVEVTLPGWGARSAGWWARARRPGSAVTVGMAPLTSRHGDGVALVLVPPHQALEIDVVVDPREPWPSPALVSSTLGFAHGREAARAERVGDPGRLRSAWRVSAEQHAAAGDDTRARAATTRAMQPVPPRLEPLVSDALAAE